MTLAAHLVVVMGTQYFDGTGAGGTDYPVTDLLQMMGRASRPNVDDSGRCVLMCHTPRKEYYKKVPLAACAEGNRCRTLVEFWVRSLCWASVGDSICFGCYRSCVGV